MSTPITINDNNFDAEVLKADKLVLVDFWAQWCGPCRTIAPILDEIAKEYQEQLKIAKLNVDINFHTASRYQVTSIPTLLLFKDGQFIQKSVGVASKQSLLSQIQPHFPHN